MSTDIFLSDIRLPPRVYILGTGPNGKPHHRDIPGNGTTILVNQAVEIPIVEYGGIGYWLCMDGELGSQSWFQGWARMLINKYNHCPIIPIFESTVLARLYPDVPYTFLQGSRQGDSFTPRRGVLHNDVTIAGMACEFAYHFGATEIILCGVDMEGNLYQDGTINPNVKDAPWPQLDAFNHLIDALESEGVKVYSLSKTMLKCRAMISPHGK